MSKKVEHMIELLKILEASRNAFAAAVESIDETINRLYAGFDDVAAQLELDSDELVSLLQESEPRQAKNGNGVAPNSQEEYVLPREKYVLPGSFADTVEHIKSLDKVRPFSDLLEFLSNEDYSSGHHLLPTAVYSLFTLMWGADWLTQEIYVGQNYFRRGEKLDAVRRKMVRQLVTIYLVSRGEIQISGNSQTMRFIDSHDDDYIDKVMRHMENWIFQLELGNDPRSSES